MRKPFRIKGRSGWHAEYKFHDGQVQRLSFSSEASATSWLEQLKAQDESAQGPAFGGPSRITLGRFLGEYAAMYTLGKEGCAQELDRINHYAQAAGLPRLKAVRDELGRLQLKTAPTSMALPSAFQKHRDARLAKRAQTYELIHALARKKVSDVRTDDIRLLMTTGKREGWSDSSIQKEVALLKAAFNSAIKEMNWHGFKNPCAGIPLGKSNTRFVVVTPAQMARLAQALSECDNPQFWPLVDLAIHSTLRMDSLLSLKWSQTDLETRRARVWGKGKWHDAQLPRRAVEILQRMPRSGSDNVFTMTPNAVNMAWEGVREKAELHGLTFRDLRHVGATAYAKAGLDVHALKRLLGHTTTRMAEVYVNLAHSDVLDALDNASEKVQELSPMPPTQHAHGKQKHPRQRVFVAPKQPAGNVYYVQRNQNKLKLVQPDEAKTDKGAPRVVAATR